MDKDVRDEATAMEYCQWLQLAVCNLAEIDNEMRETNDVETNSRRWAKEIWV